VFEKKKKERGKRGINPRRDPRTREKERGGRGINPETIIQRCAESGEANVNRKVNQCATDTSMGLAGRRLPAQSRDHGMISLFSGFRNLRAREHARLISGDRRSRRMRFFETERNARRTHVV